MIGSVNKLWKNKFGNVEYFSYLYRDGGRAWSVRCMKLIWNSQGFFVSL